MGKQETGIKDNCGGPVCEGDFIRGTYECSIDTHKLVGVVEYDNVYAAFMFVMPSNAILLSQLENIEVLDNIENNPKLWDAICDGKITGERE